MLPMRVRRVVHKFVISMTLCLGGGLDLLVCDTGQVPGAQVLEGASVWHLGEEKTHYEYRASILAPDGDLRIGAECFKAVRGEPALMKVCLWRVDPGTGSAKKIDLMVPTWDKSTPEHPRPLELGGVAIEAQGTFAVFPVLGTRPWLWRVRDESTVAAVVELLPGAGVITLNRVVTRADGYLLLGNREQKESVHSLLAQIGHDGQLRWQKTLDRGRFGMALDAVEARSGGVLVVEQAGMFDVNLRGSTTVWLTRYGADGRLLDERSLSGRHPRLARCGDDLSLLVYDASRSGRQEIRAVAFDGLLRTIWDVLLFKTRPDEVPWFGVAVATLKDCSFVIAGEREASPYAARLDREGRTLWTFQGEKGKLGSNYDVVPTPQGIFILSNAMGGGASGVRVIRLSEAPNRP